MHPYIADLYIKVVREERERQAEHARLVAVANRLRRQRLRVKKPHASIRILHWRTVRRGPETTA